MDWNCVRLKLMKRKEDSIKRKKIEGRSKLIVPDVQIYVYQKWKIQMCDGYF